MHNSNFFNRILPLLSIIINYFNIFSRYILITLNLVLINFNDFISFLYRITFS